MKEERFREILKEELFNKDNNINAIVIFNYIKELEDKNKELTNINKELGLKIQEYKHKLENIPTKIKQPKKQAIMSENIYKYVVSILNNKKVDRNVFNYLKDYDLDNLFEDNVFIQRIKNDSNTKICKKYNNKQITKYVKDKYNSQYNKYKFSTTLLHISKSKGITISEMAKRLDLSISTVSDWYNGVNFPRLDKLYLIADILDVNIEQLIKGE